MNGAGPRFANYLGSDEVVGQSRQWDLVWSDGDLWKVGLMTQGLYVSPSRDLVIVYYSVNNDDNSAHRFARPIATSGLINKGLVSLTLGRLSLLALLVWQKQTE